MQPGSISPFVKMTRPLLSEAAGALGSSFSSSVLPHALSGTPGDKKTSSTATTHFRSAASTFKPPQNTRGFSAGSLYTPGSVYTPSLPSYSQPFPTPSQSSIAANTLSNLAKSSVPNSEQNQAAHNSTLDLASQEPGFSLTAQLLQRSFQKPTDATFSQSSPNNSLEANLKRNLSEAFRQAANHEQEEKTESENRSSETTSEIHLPSTLSTLLSTVIEEESDIDSVVTRENHSSKGGVTQIQYRPFKPTITQKKPHLPRLNVESYESDDDFDHYETRLSRRDYASISSEEVTRFRLTVSVHLLGIGLIKGFETFFGSYNIEQYITDRDVQALSLNDQKKLPPTLRQKLTFWQRVYLFLVEKVQEATVLITSLYGRVKNSVFPSAKPQEAQEPQPFSLARELYGSLLNKSS